MFDVLKQGRDYDAGLTWNNLAYSDLEKTYGKYLYLPLAVPKILPYDLEKFVDYYFSMAKTRHGYAYGKSEKQSADRELFPVFLSIDSPNCLDNDKANIREDFPKLFPEILEQIYECLPVNRDVSIEYSLWSAKRSVREHRDKQRMLDLPINWRIKLYDTNPKETLYIIPDPPNTINQKQFLKIPEDSNTFAWNNLRVLHGSDFIPGHRKILMIPLFGHYVNENKLVDLLDRSVSRYKEFTMVDTYDIKNYVGDI
jgi:hypothetical protein